MLDYKNRADKLYNERYGFDYHSFTVEDMISLLRENDFGIIDAKKQALRIDLTRKINSATNYYEVKKVVRELIDEHLFK